MAAARNLAHRSDTMDRMAAPPTSNYRPARTRVVLSLAGSLMALSCRSAKPAVEAPAALADGEVRIAPDSPKWRSLQVESAEPSTERTIATLPAQAVPDEDHTVRVASPVTGRIESLDAH